MCLGPKHILRVTDYGVVLRNGASISPHNQSLRLRHSTTTSYVICMPRVATVLTFYRKQHNANKKQYKQECDAGVSFILVYGNPHKIRFCRKSDRKFPTLHKMQDALKE